MRALIVTPSYPRFEGDYHGGFIQNLCRRLAEHVDLTVLAPRTRTLNQPKEKFKVLRFPYMPLKRMEFVAEITLKGAPPINIVELPPYLFSAYFHTLKEKQVDLVNTHLAIPLGFITSLNPIRVPKVVTCHGSDCSLPTMKSVYMPFTKFALRKADRVIAVSEYIRKLTIRIGAEPKKTRKVYLGVDVERFKPIKRMHKRQTIGTLGRIVKEKNVEDIILAFKQISKHRDVKLLIGGDGPNINSLKRMAESMQLRDIHFLGRIKDPSDFYKRCDVFVLASTREGLSTSLQEAMASGCVPVAVRGCGCPELIRDEVNGFMYVPRNVKQLTLRIESALENPKMGLMARRTILDSFNAETNSLKYLDVYFELG